MNGNEFTFATFSKNEFYSTLNARLVDMADVASDKRVVDLACGVGFRRGRAVWCGVFDEVAEVRCSRRAEA